MMFRNLIGSGSTEVVGLLVCKVSQKRRRGTTESLPHNFLALFVCSDQINHVSYSLLIHRLISIILFSYHFDIYAFLQH